MTEKSTATMKNDKPLVMIPIRCAVFGKKLLNVYPNSVPGRIFATCCSGHKTSYSTEEMTRKAV